MVPLPSIGRRFTRSRPVRLGDVDPAGWLRLDALTRYTQDVSNDDTTDADLADALAWVARSTVVHVHQNAQLGEQLELTTFCGGLGRRWAERRITVSGSEGARYEVATLWVHLDVDTGRPKMLSDQFVELYGEAARGRVVKAKLTNPGLDPEATQRPWPTRAVDFDTLGHMNNAAYWAVAEEVLVERGGRPVTLKAGVEYGAGIPVGSTVTWASSDLGDTTANWLLVDGTSAASLLMEAGGGPAGAASVGPHGQ